MSYFLRNQVLFWRDNLSSLQETGKVQRQGGISDASGRNADESVDRAAKELWHFALFYTMNKICLLYMLFIHLLFTFLSISCPSKLSVHILLTNVLCSFWINSNPLLLPIFPVHGSKL